MKVFSSPLFSAVRSAQLHRVPRPDNRGRLPAADGHRRGAVSARHTRHSRAGEDRQWFGTIHTTFWFDRMYLLSMLNFIRNLANILGKE